MRSFTSPLVVFATALGLFAAAAAGQVNVFEYRATAELHSEFDEKIEFEYGGPLNANVTDPTGSAAARADVGVGVNKTVATLLGNNPTSPIETAAVDAFAEWGDVVTISDPVLNGQPGTFVARLRVDGTG